MLTHLRSVGAYENHVAASSTVKDMSDTKSSGGAGENAFSALLSETAQQLEDNHMVDGIHPQTNYDLERPLVWIDLEMTGLDPDCHTIIEIAVIVTDGELKKEIEGPNLVIHHQQDVLDNMNDWSRKQHAKSGLLQRVKDSSISMAEAQSRVLAFVQEHVAKGAAPLAGNSVYVDRLFLRKYMPDVDGYLHFRLVDVSTINELGKRWFLRTMRKLPAKTKRHTALADVRESLEELRWYRNHIFDVPKAHGESSARHRR